MRASAALVVALLAGCSTYGSREALSSGLVGCPPAEVKVIDGDRGTNTVTWTAQCRGETFFCTRAGATTCTKALATR